MVMSLLCVIRDQGLPLPAGGVLISPWVDLTHSFPSVAGDAPLDYIPQAGFHHKPSRAWPPPNEDDIAMLRDEALKKKKTDKKTPEAKELKEKQQAPVAKTEESSSSSRSDWINGGIPIDPKKLLSVKIDGQLVKLKDQIQVYTKHGDCWRHTDITRCMPQTSFLHTRLLVQLCNQLSAGCRHF